ncbi:hypothetical protein ACJRO7_025960 [Eucalyptus globulus]|uniref:Gnk2-homologous domain-containing protein n=1 Tax=Eucalyptus globulus TaxID=34317 RepID=A0ABD3KAR7_EUCGL
MAVFWRIPAIEIWFFCICVNVHCLPDTTVIAYGHNVDWIVNNLADQTTRNGYNYCTQATELGQGCYGHALCAGHLLSFDCNLCLVNAGYDLTNGCLDNTGAQEQLKDYRMRYENYEFTE